MTETSRLTTTTEVDREVDRQLKRITDAGQPTLGPWSREHLAEAANALRAPLFQSVAGLAGPSRERVPFVLVLPPSVLAASVAVPTLRLDGRSGTFAKGMGDVDRFAPIDGLDVPEGLYAVVDVWRGDEHLGRTPEDALAAITAQRRTPLTLGEGIALVTAHPDALQVNHCFQTPGSRAADRRVPGIWISGGAPRVGFCWAGNHHSWLGAASCERRVTAT